MARPTERRGTDSSAASEPSDRGDTTAVDATPGLPRARKPYHRPSIEKRRSLSQATLVGSGGVTGVAVSGPSG